MHANERNNNSFHITLQLSCKDISPCTMGAWIKHMFKECDVDTKLIYRTPHTLSRIDTCAPGR
ncbi:hypothetical protein LPJ61_005704, partial [Coemansia biformis]